MNYEEWNELLVNHFFPVDGTGRGVRISATTELFDNLYPDGCADFVAAIQKGPRGATRQGHCIRAWTLYDKWNGVSDPPFFGYLVAFVAAWAIDDDQFHSVDYYGRLRSFLGDDGVGMLPSYERMDDLWQALESWANEAENGNRGTFHARTVGPWIHVGYPQSQVYFSGNQRTRLQRIFQDHGWSPIDSPSSEVIRHFLLTHCRAILTPKQLDAATNPDTPDANALFDATSHELSVAGLKEEIDVPPRCSVVIVIEMLPVLDALQIQAFLHSNLDYPDEGLNVELADGRHAYTWPKTEGTSARLRNPDTSEITDLGPEALSNGISISIPQRGLQAKAWCQDPQFFVPEPTISERAWIRQASAPPTGPCAIVGSEEKVDEFLETTAGQPTDDGKTVHGLPPGWVWKLLDDDDRGDGGVQAPETRAGAIIRLDGGFRAGQGNVFFDFAPPTIRFSLPPEAYLVAVDVDIAAAGKGEIAGGPGTYTISIVRNDEVLQTRKVTLAVGAMRPTETVDAQITTWKPMLSVHDEWPCHTANDIILGASPGQVAHCGDERATWSPVWLICRGRPPQLYYVGSNPEEDAPTMNSVASTRLVKFWRSWTWYKRRAVKVHGPPWVQALWTEYLEAARYA